MDVFRYVWPVTGGTGVSGSGPIINNIRRKMWIERYLDAGEFTFTADVSSGIREQLPIGSFVTHADTPEIMIVENHEISESQDKSAEITVTGRSFETILEQRTPHAAQFWHFVAPDHYTSDFAVELEPLTMDAANSWVQADDIIGMSLLGAPGDQYPFLSHAIVSVSRPGTAEERPVPLKDGYSTALDFLKIDGVGIKTIRPGNWTFNGGYSAFYPTIVIHDGVLRTNSVIFGYDTGELDNAEYLLSNKQEKTAAMIQGKWFRVYLVEGVPTDFARRTITVDGTDIDQHLTAYPPNPSAERTRIVKLMLEKGKKELAAAKSLEMVKAEVSEEDYSKQYRKEFDVGDLVTARGTFQSNKTMRVVEFVEIEDETGQSGHPTLALP